MLDKTIKLCYNICIKKNKGDKNMEVSTAVLEINRKLNSINSEICIRYWEIENNEFEIDFRDKEETTTSFSNVPRILAKFLLAEEIYKTDIKLSDLFVKADKNGSKIETNFKIEFINGQAQSSSFPELAKVLNEIIEIINKTKNIEIETDIMFL